MKILLDENLPHELRGLLVGHDVFTVAYLGWTGIKNGALLTNAANESFDVMITMDQGVEYQQHLPSLPLAIMVVSAASNDIDDLRPLVPLMTQRLPFCARGTITRIP